MLSLKTGSDCAWSLSTGASGRPICSRPVLEYRHASLPVQGGWGLVTADQSLTVQAIFRRNAADGKFYEAAVPSSEGYSGVIIPFDATAFAPTGAQLYSSFAIANLNPITPAHVWCTAHDEWGAVIPDAVSIPPLNPNGHFAGFSFPALAGKRGTLDCSADTLVSAIALRAIGGEAISTLPVIPK